MMCFADRGFVFLSMPKAGSTVLQKHFARHAMILFRQPPGMKHMSAVTFEAVMAPWLERYGHPRDSYETMCLVRHPLDRAVSWWKYRARPEAAGQPNWTGDLSFAEFADRLVSGEVPLGTSSNFVTDADGAVIVDRMYRYEHLDAATAWMSERLGIAAPALEPTNVSPAREGEMDAATRARLEEHFAQRPRHLRDRHLRRTLLARTAPPKRVRGASRPTMAAMHPGFRQDIQGLRALAVLLVILDHARIGPFHGGFVGVDVFFVISGFLITGLLVSEAERTGRVSLLGFYARRARRILPAATLVIVATVAASIYFLSAVEANGVIEDALWATFFAANFKFARDGTDYFQNDTPPSPLQHYWSLAVEEQFYLVWPLLVLLLCLYAAWRARRSAGARSLGPRVRDLGVSPLVVIVGISFAYSVSFSTTDPVSAYFSPFTRAWELGIGALVACLSTRLILLKPSVQALLSWGGPGRGGGRGARLRRHHGLPGVRRGAPGRRHRRAAGRRPARRLVGAAVAAVGAADAVGRRLVLLAVPLALAGADHRQRGVAAGRRAGSGCW